MSNNEQSIQRRNPSLFQKLNKLTVINYPNIIEQNSSKLFDLNQKLPERKSKNIFKINYTFIQNDKSPSKTENLQNFPNPEPFTHKKSLFNPYSFRKITEKKRSFSENGRFSLSNIQENQGSAFNENKINFFEKPKPHSPYFEESPCFIEKSSQEQEKIEEKSFNKQDSPFEHLKITNFGTYNQIKDIKQETKIKTNSLGSRKVNFLKKTMIRNKENLLSIEPIIRKQKDNLKLDLTCLQDEYDFGVKNREKNISHHSIIVQDVQIESLKKIKSPLMTPKKEFDETRISFANPKNIILINEPKEKNVTFNEELRQSQNVEQEMQEEMSSSGANNISSGRVSLNKFLHLDKEKLSDNSRKKDKLMSKVKVNDYQIQEGTAQKENNLSKFKSCFSQCCNYLIQAVSCRNWKSIYQNCRDKIQRSFIDVLITSSNNREIDLTYRKTKKIILPGSPMRKFWDSFIMILILYQLIRIPLIIGFSMNEDDETMVLSETFLVLAFLIDIFLNFRTGYINSRGVLELYPSKIAKRYWKKYFLFDFISSIPIYDFGTNQKFLYLIRLLRISRLLRIVSRFTEYVNYHPAILRIIKSIFLLFYLWHWIACFYWYICSYEGESVRPWGIPPELLSPSASFFSKYLNSLFFSVIVTTGVGSNIVPVTDLETSFTIISTIIGVFMYSLILGAASGGLSSLDEGDSDLRKQMEALTGFLRKRKVSLDIQKRIQENLKYVWSSHQSFNVNSHWFLKGVHQLLQLELTIEINKKYLEKVPMFKHISFDCMIFLISILESRVYLPEEFVVYEQQEGKEMFFIQSGLLEVIDQSKNLRIRLIEGDFFGEQALLNSVKRNASVKSVIYSELLILTREGLKKVLISHPNFALKLFSYLKKKIYNQIKSHGDASVKSRWSFLILIIKTAMNLCKLSENSLKIESFLTKNKTIFFANKKPNANMNGSELNKEKSNSLEVVKKTNMYSGIRELSEFVITKSLKPIENDHLNSKASSPNQDSKLPMKSPQESNKGGKEPLKFKFTLNKNNN